MWWRSPQAHYWCVYGLSFGMERGKRSRGGRGVEGEGGKGGKALRGK